MDLLGGSLRHLQLKLVLIHFAVLKDRERRDKKNQPREKRKRSY